MAGQRSSYSEVLGETEAPLALHKHLARYWAAADAPHDDPGGWANRSTADPSTGAVVAIGFPVLETLRNLVLWKVEGVLRTGNPTAATALVEGSAVEQLARLPGSS